MTQRSIPEKTQRLVVAVELPDSVRQLLAQRQKGLPGMRWASQNNLHLTLRFIGEVPLAQVAAIREALQDVRAEGFLLHINGLGFFDRRPQAVLWAGVEPAPGLLELKREVDDALEKHAGLNVSGGRFSPHITLGRMKQADRKALGAFTTGDGAILAAEFTVESFTLFSSVLNPNGAVHTAEERYSLAGQC